MSLDHSYIKMSLPKEKNIQCSQVVLNSCIENIDFSLIISWFSFIFLGFG